MQAAHVAEALQYRARQLTVCRKADSRSATRSLGRLRIRGTCMAMDANREVACGSLLQLTWAFALEELVL